MGKIEEYLRTYGDAGVIVARNGFLWTPAKFKEAEEKEREEKFLAEEKARLSNQRLQVMNQSKTFP